MTFNPTQPRENDGRFGSVHRGDPGQLANVAGDPPTEVHPDGTRMWRDADGRLHRAGGPAIEYADGTRSWYVNGSPHRLGGPAVESADGTRVWCVEGRRHRLSGPAVERADGSRLWFVNGCLHRLDGPAVERASGTREWWVNDALVAEAGPGEPDPHCVTTLFNSERPDAPAHTDLHDLAEAELSGYGDADELAEWLYERGSIIRTDAGYHLGLTAGSLIGELEDAGRD